MHNKSLLALQLIPVEVVMLAVGNVPSVKDAEGMLGDSLSYLLRLLM